MTAAALLYFGKNVGIEKVAQNSISLPVSFDLSISNSPSGIASISSFKFIPANGLMIEFIAARVCSAIFPPALRLADACGDG